MKTTNESSFKLTRLFFPRMDGTFSKAPKSDNYNQAFRVQVQIIGDKNLIVLFGVSLTSEEKIDEMPVAGLVVEVAATIELSDMLNDVKELKDIPLAGNMLALLFPFLREKVNYFFSNNHVQILLNPINTIGLVNDMKIGPGFELVDLREHKRESLETSQN